jgi:hypothetical protein
MINIDFNYGEHIHEALNFWWELLVTFLGALFGFLGALWINSQFERKRENKKEEEVKKVKIRRINYLSVTLKKVLKFLPKQIKKYEEYSQLIESDPYSLHDLEILASFDLYRLKNLDNNEMFDAYLYFFKSDDDAVFEEYKELFIYSDYLYILINEIETSNQRHRTFKHKDQLFIKDCFEEISYRLDLRMKKIIKENPNDYSENEELKFISEYDNIFSDLNRTALDFGDLQNDFLRPLHDNLIDNIHDKELRDKIYILTKKALSRIKNLKFNAEEYAKFISNAKKSIEKKEEKLKEIYEKLEKNSRVGKGDSHP